MSLAITVKSIQDIMRKDVGVDAFAITSVPTFRNALQIKNLRYSRVQLCATTFGSAEPETAHNCRTLAHRNVAQIFNLLYRRVALGRALAIRGALAYCRALGFRHAPQITNLRYSRVQLCATTFGSAELATAYIGRSMLNPKTEVGAEIDMVNRQSDAVGSALRCAPPPANGRILSYHDGAHGVTRPTTTGSPKSSRLSLLNFGFRC